MRRLPSEPEYIRERRLIREQIERDKRYFIYVCVVLAVAAVSLAVLFLKTSPIIDNIKYKLNDIDCEIRISDFDFGDGIYFECEGENALIDSGTKQHTDELLEFIESKGIKRLDYFLISDASTEYTETLEKIINAVDIMKVVIPKCDEETYSLYDELLLANAENLWSADKLTYFAVNKMMFEVIDKEEMSLKISFGNNSFLIYNFVDENSEFEFINSEPDLDSDVLISLNGKLPSDKFFETFTPEVLVISGKKDVDISSAEKFTEDVYKTDSNGNIRIKSDEVDIEIECENQ